jgi:hypothetical protein
MIHEPGHALAVALYSSLKPHGVNIPAAPGLSCHGAIRFPVTLFQQALCLDTFQERNTSVCNPYHTELTFSIRNAMLQRLGTGFLLPDLIYLERRSEIDGFLHSQCITHELEFSGVASASLNYCPSTLFDLNRMSQQFVHLSPLIADRVKVMLI